jgi:hypothetical protein
MNAILLLARRWVTSPMFILPIDDNRNGLLLFSILILPEIFSFGSSSEGLKVCRDIIKICFNVYSVSVFNVSDLSPGESFFDGTKVETACNAYVIQYRIRFI